MRRRYRKPQKPHTTNRISFLVLHKDIRRLPYKQRAS